MLCFTHNCALYFAAHVEIAETFYTQIVYIIIMVSLAWNTVHNKYNYTYVYVTVIALCYIC